MDDVLIKQTFEENFYLDNKTNIYSPCYERCGNCSKEVEEINHKCDIFAKDEEDNYIILFIIILVNVLLEEEKSNGIVLNRTDILMSLSKWLYIK